LSVELSNGRFGSFAVGVFDEGKPARTSGLAIEGAHDLSRFTDRRKMHPQIVFGGLVGEITYEQSNRWHG
jgi:hypothetical protein